ncbi:winged helix-turn-helix domain-containing protein [Xylanimonas cellulosilytica]|uniref:winged helix-turn-helix domain-containing protein n=1 Tax=Xylanimonas cellulosilytica TaxID=186189 RepID=UPI0024796D03|nr:winged helix-turn-helix domain-containing protein [Xylanimonas cellulosilytica]
MAQGRGLVVYVGLSEARARASGTSLERIAYALRVQLDALLPEADAEIKLVRGPGGDTVSDLDVVREARQAGRGRPLPPAAAAHAVADGVDIDLDRQCVRIDGRAVTVSAQQFALLRLLVEASGITLSRHELASALGTQALGNPAPGNPTPGNPAPGQQAAGTESRQVDVLVRRLRARLEPYSAVVRTVRGVGYRFDPHPDVHVRAAGRQPAAGAADPGDALTAARTMRAALERHINDVC